jgi:hypothetical protein
VDVRRLRFQTGENQPVSRKSLGLSCTIDTEIVLKRKVPLAVRLVRDVERITLD